jgi:uncharacterized protein (DUF885 family)
MVISLATASRRQVLAGLGASVSALAIGGCAARAGQSLAVAPSGSLAPDALLDRVAWNLLELSPAGATSLGVDTGEHAYLRSELGGAAPADLEKLAAVLRSDLASVRAVDKQGIDPATVTSLEVVESAYSVALDGLALPYGDVAVGGWRNAPYVVIQNVGAYIDLPRFMDATHPVREASDAAAYVARLGDMPALFDGELARMRAATAMGVIPPSFLLDKAIPQMERTIEATQKGELYSQPLRVRTDDAGIAASYAESVMALETGPVMEALQRQLAELRIQRERATGDAGMWAQPRGEEWYGWALRASTTTRLSADEIHRMGLDEMQRLHGQMEPILASFGYTEGSMGERMEMVRADPQFQFAEGDPGRAEIVTFIRERIDWIKAQMPRAFRTQVDANVEVRRLPLAEEPGAPSAYGGAGSIDGSIPPRMWINLRTTDLHRKYDIPTLVHHETIPGHVWEGEFSNKLPLIRSMLAFNAFSEGWALYAEQLADELGAYEDDPVGRLGYLQNQAWRAGRLVVDTGLHAKRWTREESIAYFQREVGLSLEETTSEVERYCSWPGQACGYMVGRLQINRERERAKAALGASYDLRDFNDAVVKGGNAPLDVLAKNIDRYIAQASV